MTEETKLFKLQRASSNLWAYKTPADCKRVYWTSNPHAATPFTEEICGNIRSKYGPCVSYPENDSAPADYTTLDWKKGDRLRHIQGNWDDVTFFSWICSNRRTFRDDTGLTFATDLFIKTCPAPIKPPTPAPLEVDPQHELNAVAAKALGEIIASYGGIDCEYVAAVSNQMSTECGATLLKWWHGYQREKQIATAQETLAELRGKAEAIELELAELMGGKS